MELQMIKRRRWSNSNEMPGSNKNISSIALLMESIAQDFDFNFDSPRQRRRSFNRRNAMDLLNHSAQQGTENSHDPAASPPQIRHITTSENVRQRGVLFFRGMLNFLGGCSFFRGKSVHLVIFYVTGYSQSHVLFSDMFKNIRGIRGCSLFQRRLIFQRHPSFFKLVSLFHHVSMIF